MLQRKGYRIKVLNTINFKKSMKYNPFAYIHDEKDILKLVTTLIANTKGDGKGGDPFWEKAETLLYTALIGYIHYEAPEEEQNFSTLVEFINSMEVREDDEEFKNSVDLMFDELEEKSPDHFAVRQYKKFKLSIAATSRSCRRAVSSSWYNQTMERSKPAPRQAHGGRSLCGRFAGLPRFRRAPNGEHSEWRTRSRSREGGARAPL